MLPRRQREKQAPILPVARTSSTQLAPSESAHIPALVETEANECPLPEIGSHDAEIREMQSGEVAAGELGNSRSVRRIPELPGMFSGQEMQAVEMTAAELKGST